MRLRAALLALVGAIAYISLHSVPAYAVESFGVGAKPANPRADNPRSQSIFVYELKPGSVVKDAVTISNNTQQKKTISVYAVDSQNSSDGAFACAQAADQRKSVGNWVTLASPEVQIDANQQKTIPFTINVPKNADVGEQNGCIAVQASDAVTKRDQNGIALSFRSALRIAITVPGDLKTDLYGKQVDISIAKSVVTVSPHFVNNGNVSVDSKINASLTTLIGSKSSSTEGTFPVLRDSEGTFNFELKKPFWGGFYNVKAKADYKPLSNQNAQTAATNVLAKRIYVQPAPLALAIEIIAAVTVATVITVVILRRKRHAEYVRFAKEYIVKKGDDIQSIAGHYQVSWELLARINKLKPPYTLKVGETIRIPSIEKKQKKG